jgi:hypothetical protein
MIMAAGAVNFPDVLGAVTGGVRVNQGVVQVASALRPRVIMAGRSLEMLLLLQNAANVEVQIIAELQLPPEDAKGQKGRIIAKSDALKVRLGPGAVGVVVLPLATLPDIAVSAGYPIGMDVKTTLASGSKPQRVRSADGGEPFDGTALAPDKHELFESLKKLNWTGKAKGSVVESALTVMSGKVGALPDLKPSFTLLWSPTDAHADPYLLMLLGSVIYQQVLPALKTRQCAACDARIHGQALCRCGVCAAARGDRRHRALPDVFAGECCAQRKADFGRNARASQSAGLFQLRRHTAIGFASGAAASVAARSGQSSSCKMRVWHSFPVKAVAHFAYDGLLRDALRDAFQTAEAVLQDGAGHCC